MSLPSHFFRLDSRHCTLILYSVGDGVPEPLYYGDALDPDIHLPSLQLLQQRPLPHCSLDAPVPRSLFPEASRGFMGNPALAAHRSGIPLNLLWQLAETKQDSQGLVFHLKATGAALDLELRLSLHQESDVLITSTQLTNHGSPVTVEAICGPSLWLPSSFNTSLTLAGAWGAEFQREQASLLLGAQTVISNRRGRTSHEHLPAMVVGEGPLDEVHAPLLGFHMGWSGNYQITVEKLASGDIHLQGGELFLPGELVLEAGDTYQSPSLYATICRGLTTMSQRFHDYARSCILPDTSRREPPVMINSWESMYFDHNPDGLVRLAKAAASVGAEVFILDDGWFSGRSSDRVGLGDWLVDPDRYPQGLHPLIKELKSAGLAFGLWLEPEMVNPDSQLYRHHPEWVVHDRSCPLLTERHQLVLNLDRDDVYQYLYSAITKLLDEYPVEYVKWDMNRTLLNPVGVDGKASAHRQVQAVYRLMAAIRESYPHVAIESCSSGGGRVDFGVLRYASRVWTSDNNDPLSRADIQRGFSLFFPPEIMGCHVGGAKAHLSACVSDANFRSMVALQGQFGFEMDLSKATDADGEVFRHYCQLYKDNRGWISQARVYRGTSGGRCCSILGYVSQDQCSSLWWILTDRQPDARSSSHFWPQGLVGHATYECQLVSLQQEDLNGGMKQGIPLLEGPIQLSGQGFMQAGISLPTLRPQSGLLLSIKQMEEELRG